MAVKTDALCRGTILNGKYIIDDVIQVTDVYMEYNAVDLVIKEEVTIRELFLMYNCCRNIEESDNIFTNNNSEFIRKMDEFKYNAAAMARRSEGIFAKNFFYENNTGYIVFSKNRNRGKIIDSSSTIRNLLIGLLVILIAIVALLLSTKKGHELMRSLTGKTNEQESTANEETNAGTTGNNSGDSAAENPETSDKTSDGSVISEAEYLEMYNGSNNLYIREYLYDDFDNNGTYEIFMVKSAAENWKNQIEELEERMKSSATIDDEEQYKKLKNENYSLWYADKNGEYKLTEVVEGETWQKPLYNGLEKVAQESEKHVLLHSGFSNGAWGSWVSKSPCEIFYGVNDSGTAYEIQKFEDSVAEVENGMILMSVEEYGNFFIPEPGFTGWMVYPLIYKDGKYTEIASVEVDKRILHFVNNWDVINEKILNILQNEGYENGPFGELASEIDLYNTTIDSVLYGDGGKLYINYSSDGHATVGEDEYKDDNRLFFEAEMEISGNIVSDIHVMQGRRVASYYGADNAIITDVTPLYEGLGITEEDIQREAEIVKLNLIVGSADDVVVLGDQVFLTGTISYSTAGPKDTTIVVDNDTLVIPDNVNEYEDGMTGYDLLVKLKLETELEGNAMAVCGVYGLEVSGDHAETITGLYWWD